MAEVNGASVPNGDMFRSVYDDSVYFIENIINEYKIFPTILDRMRQGEATLELRKRFLLRAIDETWVNIVEDSLPSLDAIIRNPGKFIEEKEEVVPVEFARKITVRTLQHLSQHTDYISKIEGDTIIPSKLLNVYKDETMQTYENKFINTLINRLYLFVNRRYEIALNAGQDEKTTSIEFKDNFDHDDVKVKMNFKIEISEASDGLLDRVERNYSYTTDLWRRVVNLNGIVTNYANSEFVKQMGHSYIRPPVMRTNAILKNKNFRQCYALWQFIEGYDSAGYSMLIQENLEDVDENYIKELYSTLALQYLIFRYNIKNEFEADNTLASNVLENELKPRIVDELSKMSENAFDVDGTSKERIAPPPAETRYGTLTPEDMILLESLDVAMDATELIRKNGEEFIYDSGAIPEPEPVEDKVYDDVNTAEPEDGQNGE
ncbi:MAG: DUF2357 domain-containing protein [Clostridia bacterium]|nr:DUF2357 domain-containing protein [Clostridia bacterium]